MQRRLDAPMTGEAGLVAGARFPPETPDGATAMHRQGPRKIESLRLRFVLSKVEAEVRRYEAEVAFMQFDEDAGTVEEFGKLLSALGLAAKRGEVESLARTLDEDGSGEIDMEEFVRWYCSSEPDPAMTPGQRARMAVARAKIRALTAARNLTGRNDRDRALYSCPAEQSPGPAAQPWRSTARNFPRRSCRRTETTVEGVCGWHLTPWSSSRRIKASWKRPRRSGGRRRGGGRRQEGRQRPRPHGGASARSG